MIAALFDMPADRPLALHPVWTPLVLVGAFISGWLALAWCAS